MSVEKPIKAKPRKKPSEGFQWVAVDTYQDGELVSRSWVEIRVVKRPVIDEEFFPDSGSGGS